MQIRDMWVYSFVFITITMSNWSLKSSGDVRRFNMRHRLRHNKSLASNTYLFFFSTPTNIILNYVCVVQIFCPAYLLLTKHS